MGLYTWEAKGWRPHYWRRLVASVYENSLLDDHKILLPPRARGTITHIAEKGIYTVDEKVLEVEFDGKTSDFSMMHTWPTRVPRPVTEKLPSDSPFIVGQRVLDAFFPSVQPCSRMTFYNRTDTVITISSVPCGRQSTR